MKTALKKYGKTIFGSGLAVAAAPVMVFIGAGTAQADTYVTAYPNPVGVRIVVTEDSKKSGWCTYTATPQGSLLLPYTSLPFRLEAGQRYEFLIPGVPTGTKWIPQVNCDHGANLTTWSGSPAPIVY